MPVHHHSAAAQRESYMVLLHTLFAELALLTHCEVCASEAVCLQADLHWTTAFTSRLSDSVKLVGSTVSCGSTFQGELHRSPSLTCPHVQSYALATDQIGLRVCRPSVERLVGCLHHGLLAVRLAALHDAQFIPCNLQ